jgi:hypothetical protein
MIERETGVFIFFIKVELYVWNHKKTRKINFYNWVLCIIKLYLISTSTTIIKNIKRYNYTYRFNVSELWFCFIVYIYFLVKKCWDIVYV